MLAGKATSFPEPGLIEILDFEKGWICKTWEGELVTGAMLGNQEKFQFSVRGEDLANEIGKNIGKRVEIDYDQHVGVPTSCFAETEYYVKAVKTVNDPTGIPGLNSNGNGQ